MSELRRISRDKGRTLYILRQLDGRVVREQAALIGVTPRVLRCAEKGAVPQAANAQKIAAHYGRDPFELWPLVDQNGKRLRLSTILRRSA